MFDERFARQYRYDPPSEFLLTSTYTSKVHLLSGRIDAPPFPRKSKPKRRTELRPARGQIGSLCFRFASGCSTHRLGTPIHSLVRVSRRDSHLRLSLLLWVSLATCFPPSRPGTTSSTQPREQNLSN